MSIEDNIVSPSAMVQDQGAKVLVYGASGSGKTYLCSTAPGKKLVISAEAGLLSIKDKPNIDAIEVKEAAEVMELHNSLRNGKLKGKYDTVCLDSISEISELLLSAEKAKHKDARMAYGNVQETVTNVMRAFRDLQMHVIFLCKEEKINVDGSLVHEPKMVGAKLGQSIPYFFDEVLALRVIERQDDEGNLTRERWLQTEIGQGFNAKDRSGLLEPFEQPNLTNLITKLGFISSAPKVQEVKTAEGGS